MALTITKAYAAGSALTEAHIDNFRNGLHTFFNTDKIPSASFDAGTALTGIKFGDTLIVPTDNVTLDYGTGSDASIKLDADKNFVFDTAANTTKIRFYAGTTYYLEITNTVFNSPGDIILAQGGANHTILQALSLYKKPVLEWNGASSIQLSNNSDSTDESIIYFPSYCLAAEETISGSAKYRYASILTEANGYQASGSGTAKGGRRVGLALTTNSWYYVYAVGLRSGTNYDASALKFVMVFDTTAPYQTNEATLDGYYGSGNWVYLGLVRYGYGAVGSNSSIIKFKYSNKGWCYFYGNDSSAAFGGLNLAYTTTDGDDTSSPFYTLTNGTSGNKVPDSVGHVLLNLTRDKVSDWYITDSSGDIIWRGGWQTDDSSKQHGFMVPLPLITTATEYKIYQSRKGTGAGTARAVALVGFVDTYMAHRRGGHGV